MSTRATYLFLQLCPFGSEITPICLFVPYDGYPKGAASYFHLMQQCENKTGGLAEQFLRSVDLAEFIPSHEHRNDIAYRYTINKNGFLQAWEWNNEDASPWHLFFEGQWHHFVNKFSEPHVFLHEFKVDCNSNEILTLNQAQIRVRQRKAYAKEIFQRGHTINANEAYANAQNLQQQIMEVLQSTPALLETLTDQSEIDSKCVIEWTVDTVLLSRPDLSYEQAIHVLNLFAETYKSNGFVQIKNICNNMYPKCDL